MLQDGTVIDDLDIATALEAPITSIVPSDPLASASTKRDSSILLAHGKTKKITFN